MIVPVFLIIGKFSNKEMGGVMLEKDYLLTQKTYPKEMQQQAVVYPAMHNGCCFRCGQSFLDEA